ncbi:MAG: cytochrome c3 family protein [Fidelibacterota bacterium]
MNKPIIGITLLLVCAYGLSAQSSIINTKHNLSISGTGELKSTEENEVCIFCHATHGGATDAPLWNRSASNVTYTLYGSPSLQTNTMQPGQSSRLCLSCHDGTVALGLVLTRPDPIAFPVGMDKIPTSYRTNLSENLSDDHPLNLDSHPVGYNCNGCHDMHTDESNPLECSSCHDPHDNSAGDFLVENPVGGAICARCHNVSTWSSGAHFTSTATWNGQSPDPWPNTDWTTVNENSCNNCHTPHGGNGAYWLLKASAEEDNCLICHNGNVAQADIQSSLVKSSTHPVEDYTMIHSPNEDLNQMSTHVECTDCHSPHTATTGNATAPYASGALSGASGVDKSGSAVNAVAYEYEVCLKCHENALGNNVYVPRLDSQTNLRLEFSESNPSYHPVFGIGRNNNVPSLITPWNENSIMYCTDCHNNNGVVNGQSPNGPHGSNYTPILERQQIFSDYNSESSSIYALCYKCHDRASILNDESRFKHKEHVEKKKAACTTCHDPHGSYNNTHLINFNTDYVTPNSQGSLYWEDLGNNHGKCYLRCHGEDHKPEDY